MKIAVVIARIIFGLLFLVSGLAYFFKLMPQAELPGSAQTFVTGLFAAGYVMPLVKVIEVICGIAFLTNRFVSVALVVIFPITLNVLLFHMFLAPEGIAIPVLLMICNLFLAFSKKEQYQPILSAR
jgi:putative oxidoreductase